MKRNRDRSAIRSTRDAHAPPSFSHRSTEVAGFLSAALDRAILTKPIDRFDVISFYRSTRICRKSGEGKLLAKFPLLRRNDSDSARMTREYVATRLNCVSRRSDRFSPGVEIDKILVKIPRTFLHPVYKRRESSTSRWSPINSPTPSTAFRLMNVCFSTRIFPSNDFARVRSAAAGHRHSTASCRSTGTTTQ